MSKSLLTSGRGFLTWQLSPPTITMLGMRGRGNSKTVSVLFWQNMDFESIYIAGKHLVTYQLHNLCTFTLAARCQTLARHQQCPLPPPRIDRQCSQIPNTITCTSVAPLRQPEGIIKQLNCTKVIIEEVQYYQPPQNIQQSRH